MKLPAIEGTIRRRILLNFRVDPEVMQAQLPSRFKPKLHADHAIGGICLIRLENMRPKLLPSYFGISSENAAHRVAITWNDESGALKEGVFIPRRDTSSMLNHLAGGRIFPGEHHLATFNVKSSEDAIDFEMKSRDGDVAIRVKALNTTTLPATSCFRTLSEASAFFEPGSVGFSVTRDSNRLDGISLQTETWRVEPLDVKEVYSSYFADVSRFPAGSVEFDCALLMSDIAHEWHSEPDLCL